VVFKGEMFQSLYKHVGNMQMGGAIVWTSASDSSRIHVARRKQVMLSSCWRRRWPWMIELDRAIGIDFYQGGDCWDW